MISHGSVLTVSLLASLGLLGAMLVEDTKKAAPQEMGMMGKPTEHHAHLKAQEGVWDATVSGMGPESKGTETNTMACGGLWLVSDFKGDVMGMPFSGHGITGYDPAKAKYVGTWVDSMTTSLLVMEGTCDKSGKVMTMMGEGPDMMGKMVKMKMVTEMKDADTRVFTVHMPGPDGKEAPSMTITYRRRK